MALQDLRFNITAVDETGTAFKAAAAQAQVGSQAVAQAAGKAAAGQEEVAMASAAVTRELIVLGREGMVGNFSRLPGSILALSERLQSTGTSVLNLGTVFKIFGSVAGAIFNPVVLGIVGFSAAIAIVPRLFGAMGASADTVNEVLKTHKALLDQIKQAYGDAGIAAAKYATGADEALSLKRGVQQDVETLGAQLTASLNKVSADIGRIRFFGNLSGEAGSFRQAILAGGADLEAFRAKLLETATNPAVDAGMRHQADLLLAMTSNAQKLTGALAEAHAAEWNLAHTISEDAGVRTSFSVGIDTASLAKAKESLRSQLKALAGPSASTDTTTTVAANNQWNESIAKTYDALREQTAALTETDRQKAIDQYLIQAHVSALSEDGKAIAEWAGRNYDAAEAQKALTARMDENRSMLRDALGTMKSDLGEGKNLWTALGDAAKGAMDKILNSELDQVVTLLAGKSGTTDGGLLGSFFSSLGKLFGFAEGGTVIAGGAGGPDSQLFAARVTPGERIDFTPPGKSRSGGGLSVQHVVNNYAGVQTRQRTEQTPNGIKLITDIVDSHIGGGGADRAVRGRFGLRPSAVRGG